MGDWNIQISTLYYTGIVDDFYTVLTRRDVVTMFCSKIVTFYTKFVVFLLNNFSLKGKEWRTGMLSKTLQHSAVFNIETRLCIYSL